MFFKKKISFNKLFNKEWCYINYLIKILFFFYIWTNTVNYIKNEFIIYNLFKIYNLLFNYLKNQIWKLCLKKKYYEKLNL
jgi:hypothetical protein